MRASSQKKHYRNQRRFCVAALLILTCQSAAGRSLLDLSYWAKFTSRAALHINNPRDLAMHRHTVEAEQTIKEDRWSVVAGVRAYAEAAFVMNDRYAGAPVGGIESQEFVPRDLYVQYKGSGVQARVGFQQVVWGESFGFFFADVVNPKDTREFGLGGDLAAQRITVPMLNLVWFLGDSSLQALWIPRPVFNMTPALGSDFSFPIQDFFTGMTVTVNDERFKDLALENSEVGLRATTVLGGWDMAAFYFYYFDRRPSYRPTIVGSDVTIRGVHEPISSVGLTATKDLQTWVARFELLYTTRRPVDAFTTLLGYYTALSDEIVGVVGFDYTQWKDWRLSFQLSQNSYFKEVPGSLLRQHSTNVSLIVGGSLFHNHEFNFITNYSTNDGSALWQITYMVPISSRLEASIGAHFFTGGQQSQYGLFKDASRAFIQLKGYFGGT